MAWLSTSTTAVADHDTSSTLLITAPAHQHRPMCHDTENSIRCCDVTIAGARIVRRHQVVTALKFKLQQFLSGPKRDLSERRLDVPRSLSRADAKMLTDLPITVALLAQIECLSTPLSRTDGPR